MLQGENGYNLWLALFMKSQGQGPYLKIWGPFQRPGDLGPAPRPKVRGPIFPVCRFNKLLVFST